MSGQPGARGWLTKRDEIALAIVGGILVANAYYIHPIISQVAAEFGVSAAMIGLVPALNQIALALGIFLLLPLGDRYSNRRLAILFAAGQTAALVVMILAPGYIVFVAGSTILGFFTIAPYLLPAYASKRVPPERLGSVTATLTAGTIFGILMARVGAGAVAQYYDWHLVYVIAAALMIGTTLILSLVMEPRREAPEDIREDAENDVGRTSYRALIISLFALLRAHPNVFVSGIIQALNFGMFLAIWLGLALYLPGPEMGYGVDIVGYLAGFAIVSIFATPRLGVWADRVGAEKARFRLAIVQMVGIVLLLPLGGSLWLLLIPILIMNTVGPAIDVAGRMTSLAVAPEIRTRLMTGYIVLMFIGAGLASWGGTAAYDWAGWTGTTVLVMAMSTLLVWLSWREARPK